MNTAIAGAKDPIAMARAMKLAVEAGRIAYRAGRIERKLYATASSPLTGLIRVGRNLIIACAAGGRGDPCTQ